MYFCVFNLLFVFKQKSMTKREYGVQMAMIFSPLIKIFIAIDIVNVQE